MERGFLTDDEHEMFLMLEENGMKQGNADASIPLKAIFAIALLAKIDIKKWLKEGQTQADKIVDLQQRIDRLCVWVEREQGGGVKGLERGPCPECDGKGTV